MNFKEFDLDPKVIESIEAIGYETATPVQEKTIPAILAGKDIIASAQTGTGKTAAFLLPIINKIATSEQNDKIKALIIVPTRELAMQIDQQLEGFSYFTSVRSIAVYGGQDGSYFTQEKQALSEGTDIVVCTPGKMIVHLNLGYVNISSLQYLILDEADRMLDMGFVDDINRIISYLPKKRQNLLFSATMPNKIKDLARKILIDPKEISIAISKPAEKILQVAYVVYENQKIPLLRNLLQSKHLKSAIVFCSTKLSAKQLSNELKKINLAIEDIHSDLEQSAREQVLSDFKNHRLNILVATDIISRGIDIENIDLIVNYDVPNEKEDYIHRIGRTARAEADGVAITLINENEQRKFLEIEEFLEKTIHKIILPQEYGEVPEYSPKSYKKDKRHKRDYKKNIKKKHNKRR